MNRKTNYNNNRKSSKTTSSKKNQIYIKNVSNQKNKYNSNIMNQLDNYNNNPFTQSEYYKNKKQLNKMMKDYQIFVKKYIGDAIPISSITEERMNKLLNEENYRNKNVFLDEEYNNEFQQILKNNKDLDFGEEIISMELPSDDEF